MEEKLIAFQRILNIIDELRQKCPWDAKQTNESLRHLTLEEVYELSQAIMENNPSEIKKELGDVLLHILFYSKIAQEKHQFDIKDVINSLADKLIYRHPHIYGDVKAEDEHVVKQNWEKLKIKQGNKYVLEGVPDSLPSLIKAIRIQEKASGIGFDWKDSSGVLEKIEEEVKELQHEIYAKQSQEKIEEEFGDVLFSLVNYARSINVNPDLALEKANIKFKKRFMLMEDFCRKQNVAFSSLNIEQMEELWQKAKKQLQKH